MVTKSKTEGREASVGRRALAWLAVAAAFSAGVTSPGCWLKSDGSGPVGIARCGQARDCPASVDACSTPTCSAEGICGTVPVTDGISTTQIVGDCLLARCVSGVTTQLPDGNDSNDSNPCTTDDCAVSPPHAPLADGTACMLGAGVSVCHAGTCAVPCNAGSSCDDTNPCTTDTCADTTKLCVFSSFNGDAPVADPDPHDCKKPFCAAGTLTEAPNDLETPDDNKPCTTDVCSSGQPTHSPVASGMSPAGCGLPQKCDGAGTCVNCATPAECSVATECSDPTCILGVCGLSYHLPGEIVATQTPQDCTVRVCTGNTPTAVPQADVSDVQNDMNACTTDTCSGTTPVHTATPGASCMGTKFCSAGGACVDCFVSANCPSGSACQAGICYSCSNNVMDPGETGVDCGNSTCGLCAGQACATGCKPGLSCVDGTCCTTGSCPDCSTCANVMGQCSAVSNGTNDGGCVAPAQCQGGGCIGKTQGSICGLDGECASGHCTDGFCCNAACLGSCQACSNVLSGKPNGTCGDITHGTDPAMECAGAQVCCGANNCGAVGCP